MSNMPDTGPSPIPVLCRACEARHRGICGALHPAQLSRLARTAIRRECPSGSNLASAGSPVTSHANILSGVVKLTKLMPDGRQQVVGLQFAPDFLGRPFAEVSDVTAEAAGTVRLCIFQREELEEMAVESPGLSRRLHAQALRELDDARDWMLTLGKKSASERVASVLLLIGTHIDPEAEGCSPSFELPLRRSDIADFLGLTIETVSRQITALRRRGIIAVDRNRLITVLDLQGLESAAGG
ncbi:Crp/Fnr family transcriptional regulator [Paracoccus suum]|uniref:Crp/Fnr family transcriptional regulator n=1 Tax=Paracoccus suum TaxID=2259340 RepID=A0A344PME0_9RHOB|nr:Crp/Fnr family transcriptional regulator [Paracoccus suum]AXC50545.1 Crp/Fnr family transcriptional regulator [Paracoccus suum]